MSTRTRRPRSVLVALGLAGLVLGAHLTATALYVTPPTPLKYALQGPVNSWMNPFFEQNWQLFAPDPVRTDGGLLVRATTPDGTTTDYLTVNAAYLEARHHNLLPDRSYYTVSGVTHAFLMSRDQAVEALHPDGARPDLPLQLDAATLAELPAGTRATYETTLRDLRDVAVDAARGAWGDVTHVQVRLVTHEFPRWSQRHDEGLGEISHVTFPWHEVDATGPAATTARGHDLDPTGETR